MGRSRCRQVCTCTFERGGPEQLLAGAFLYQYQLQLNVPEELLVPPQHWAEAPKQGFESDNDLNVWVTENWRRADVGRIKYEGLQGTVRNFQKIQRGA